MSNRTLVISWILMTVFLLSVLIFIDTGQNNMLKIADEVIWERNVTRTYKDMVGYPVDIEFIERENFRRVKVISPVFGSVTLRHEEN